LKQFFAPDQPRRFKKLLDAAIRNALTASCLLLPKTPGENASVKASMIARRHSAYELVRIQTEKKGSKPSALYMLSLSIAGFWYGWGTR
jgi:hypothetical protein